MSRKRKAAMDDYHPVEPPGSNATVEARLRAVEQTLGTSHRTFYEFPHWPGPFTKKKPGVNDLIIRLKCFCLSCAPETWPQPEPEPNQPQPEAVQ